jgi:hypothetical protein
MYRKSVRILKIVVLLLAVVSNGCALSEKIGVGAHTDHGTIEKE